jgi:hypothetical protein
MDEDTPSDDKFQYLRFNIIDWRRVGNEASGSYREKYLAMSPFLTAILTVVLADCGDTSTCSPPTKFSRRLNLWA